MGIYIHLPYCVHHCVYCDFNVRQLRRKDDLERYLEALLKEIAYYGKQYADQRSVDTIYLGGGTPSLFSAEQIQRLLRAVHHAFEVSPAVEISMEANPNSITFSKMKAFKGMGMNRLSIGVQSFQSRHLKTLERIHSPLQAVDGFWAARKAGFEQINLDLIFGLPNQSLEAFQADVEMAVGLNPEHLSTYHLTVGPRNPLSPYLPDEGLSTEMYLWVARVLPRYGYEHYEVSAFAKPGAQCQHHLKYWGLKDFLGLGAGAYSRLTDLRRPWGLHLKNVDRLETYCCRIHQQGEALEEQEPLTRKVAQKDFLIAGLRLLKGIAWAEFEARFQESLMISYGNEVRSLMAQGLLDSTAKMLKLTPRGLLYLNKVLVEFM